MTITNHMRCLLRTAAVAVPLAFLAGCQKQSAVDLVDPDAQSPLLEIVTPPAASPVFGTGDIDPSGLFPISRQRAFGQLIVAGTEFDSMDVHHQGSLARAIFFDRSAPVIVGNDTVGFKTLDAGIVGI